MIRPFPRYGELYQRRGLGHDTAAARRCGASAERDLRDLQVLVQPGLDPSAGLRARRRPARAPRQGPRLHRGREAAGCSTSSWTFSAQVLPLHREAGRARPGRADDDAVLSPDPAAAVGQEAGPRGDARRQAAAATRTATPRTPAVHVRTRRRAARTSSSAAAARHVAGRGLRVPGDDPAAGRARHPLDRHRRGDPLRLDRTASSAATARATSATRSCCIARTRSREGEHELAHRLPRSRPERPDRLPLPAQRRRSRRPTTSWPVCTPSADASTATTQPALVSVILDGENCWEHYPDGGVRLPARAVSQRCTATPGDPAGDASATIWSGIRRTTRCRTCSPAAGSATTSPSGSATRRTTRRGTLLHRRASIPASSSGTIRAEARSPAEHSAPGLGGAVHRRGERLVLVVRRRPLQRPGRAVRLPVPQAPAERLHAAGRRAAGRPGAADQPARPARRTTRQPRASCDVKIDGRRHVLRVDQRRPLRLPATSAARWRMVDAGARWRTCTSAST